MKKLLKYFTNSDYRFLINDKLGLYKHWDDERFLKRKFKARLGYELDLKNPQTFNEKLQWLKLHDQKPEYTKMVDKYEVKKYVASIIGEEYIISTLGVWDRFDDIDFSKLPDQFVLKCTHDSGGIIICKDKSKLDIQTAKKKINNSLKRNYYYVGREWPYKDVKPRIISEPYLTNVLETELKDYKFMVFNGEVKCSFVVSNRFQPDGIKVTFFDMDWEKMPFERHYPRSQEPLDKPQNYSKMISLAEALSKNIPFVRVDFYEVQGNIYFGEMTFYPGSGFEEFTPSEWDKTLGDWIRLPEK